MPVFAVMAPRLELSLETDGVDAVVVVDFAGGGVSPENVEPTIRVVVPGVSDPSWITLTLVRCALRELTESRPAGAPHSIPAVGYATGLRAPRPITAHTPLRTA